MSFTVVAGLAALSPNPEQETAEYKAQLTAFKDIAQLVARFSKAEPPKEAADEFQKLMLQVQLNFSSQPGETSVSTNRPLRQTADEVSESLRRSAGFLTDTRAFAAEMMKALEKLSGPDSPTQTLTRSPVWQFEVNGDRAIATAVTDQAASQNNFNVFSPVELQRIDDQWRVSSLMSDEQMMESVNGPVVVGKVDKIEAAKEIDKTEWKEE